MLYILDTLWQGLIKWPELCQLVSTHCWCSVNAALLSDEYKTACFGNQASLGSLVLIQGGWIIVYPGISPDQTCTASDKQKRRPGHLFTLCNLRCQLTPFVLVGSCLWVAKLLLVKIQLKMLVKRQFFTVQCPCLSWMFSYHNKLLVNFENYRKLLQMATNGQYGGQ